MMLQLTTIATLLAVGTATITITDPSDKINPEAWATDNALLSNYNVEPIMYQMYPISGPNSYSGQHINISHATLSTTSNDTSALVIANKSDVNVDYTTIIKQGYSSNLLQASFFGLNAAVNVANDSTVTLNNINITTHNGAAGLYAYGTGTEVVANNIWSYSSGPVSHGLYGGGNGTIRAHNVQAYSGGYRSSIFSGDNPAGYVHVQNAIAHTDGIGSAICYALGLCNMTNVIGHASKSPIMFSDGAQTGIWTNCDVTAGNLGGVVMFSSATRTSGANVTFDRSKLTVLGSSTPALWFGNLIATANILSSVINNTASDVLAVANYSQMTQDFSYYAGYADNTDLLPAELTLNVQESTLSGTLLAYNKSSIAICLGASSSWTGKTEVGFGTARFAVQLDQTSNWTLTGTSALENFTNADQTLANVRSRGFNITYDGTSPENTGWANKTYALPGGGKLTPAK